MRAPLKLYVPSKQRLHGSTLPLDETTCLGVRVRVDSRVSSAYVDVPTGFVRIRIEDMLSALGLEA